MTRWTIEVPDGVAKRVADEAAQRGLTPEQLAEEAVAEAFPPRRHLGFVGLGRSGVGDLSGRVKELRRESAAEKLQQLEDERRSAEG